MWLLKHKDGRLIYLQANKTIVFGRRQADVIFENDPSISRAHASINVTLKEQVLLSEALSTCTIKDIGSKYGSTINRKGNVFKVTNEGCELQPLDEIRFGKQELVFIVQYIRLVTVTSRLSRVHSEELQDILNKIGGIIAPNFYDNCTHLTATEATTTDKIISSLIAGLPIVGISYWNAVLEAVEANESLPDPKKYTLTLTDASIKSNSISLLPNPSRKSLFQGRSFICFSDDQMKMYKKMIFNSGGKLMKCTLNESVDLDSLISENIALMQYGSTLETSKLDDDFTNAYTTLQEKLKKKGLRMISETEMPLAVLYVSTKQYCNPTYNFKQLMRRKKLQEDNSKVLALDTQDVLSNSSKSRNHRCIPETNDVVPETNDLVPETNDLVPETNNLVPETQDLQDLNKMQIDTNSEITSHTIEKHNANPSPQKLEIIKKRPREENIEDEELKNGRVTKKSNVEPQTNELKVIIKSPAKIIDKKLAEDVMVVEEDLNLPKTTIPELGSKLKESKPSTSKVSNSDTKKRQRESSKDTKEIDEWKNPKKLCSEELGEKKSSSSLSSVSSLLSENQKETDQSKKLKLNKWGFKKTEKSTSNLSIDDFISDIVSKDEKTAEKEENELGKTRNVGVEKKKVAEKKIFNEFLAPQQSNKNRNTSEKNVATDWNINTYVCKKEILSDEDIENSSTSNVTLTSSFLRSNVKLEPGTVKSEYKSFKKAYDRVPKKRVALADMSVWIPNSV